MSYSDLYIRSRDKRVKINQRRQIISAFGGHSSQLSICEMIMGFTCHLLVCTAYEHEIF